MGRRQAFPETPLFHAILRGDAEAVRQFARGSAVHERAWDGTTPLMYVVTQKRPDLCRILIDAGADVRVPSRGGLTPLHVAAREHDTELVDMLLAAGAEVDAQDEHGNTPLARATYESRGRGAMILRLLAAGADPDLPNARGVSPRALAHLIANFDVRQFFPY